MAKRSLELSESGLEALKYVVERCNEGRYEGTLSLVGDVVEAYAAIMAAVMPLADGKENKPFRDSADSVREGFRYLLSAYEGQLSLRPLEVLQLTVLPRYKRWRAALKGLLMEYVSS